MQDTTLYSIGHGTKDITQFIDELKAFDINYLIDIRTKPFSKWNPQYNQNELKLTLKEHGIVYVYMGDTLGGMPDDRSCYNSDNKVDYDVVKTKEFFTSGLSRLVTAYQKKINVVIMCSESRPEDCHRSKLIGEELLNKEIPIIHIVASNKTRSQDELSKELLPYKTDIFGNSYKLTSKGSY